MSNYLVEVNSSIRLDTDEDLKDYIEDRQREWGDDKPEEIKRLIDEGLCTLSDETGTTTIKIYTIDAE